VEFLVVGDEFGGVEALEFPDCLLPGLLRDGGIDAGNGPSQAVKEQDVLEALPFGRIPVGGDVRAAGIPPALPLQERTPLSRIR
jgi:hypothetical protein